MQIKWKKISQYCIEYNNIYISKYKVENDFRYVLWHNSKLIKVFESALSLIFLFVKDAHAPYAVVGEYGAPVSFDV